VQWFLSGFRRSEAGCPEGRGGWQNKLFLAPEERKIVLGLSEGHSAKEIALQMHLTSSAINKKLHFLCKRFGAATPVQLLLLLSRKKEI
jgi:DNA-binding NarL/FixJ family response regulator